MKLAVIAGNLDPEIGGGATLCRSLLQETKQTPILGAGHEQMIFVRGKTIPSFCRDIGETAFYKEKDLPKIMKRYGCDSAWFMTGGGFPPPLPLPYLATVWDLQHRTHPYLPEMQKDNEWIYREEKTSLYLQQAASVVVGTHIGAQEISNFYNVPAEKISCIPFPVPSWGQHRESEYPPEKVFADMEIKEPFFVYPAQFWAHKNHAVLLYACKILKERGIYCQIVCPGGDGGNLSYLKKLVMKLGIEGQVIFPGFVSEDTLQQLYKKSLGLVYPSLSGPDNLPPLESLSLGRPVIQADFPGAREQLGETVDYANAFKEEDWAQAMIQLINSPKSAHGSSREDAIESLLKNRTTSGYVSQIRNILSQFVALVRCWS